MKFDRPTKKINLGNKKIVGYTPNKNMEIDHMYINGRHPEDPHHYIYETGVDFMVYVLKGEGTIYENEIKHQVKPGDVLFIPKNSKFAAEGKDFEYLTFEVPAWYKEQASIVDKEGNLIEETNI